MPILANAWPNIEIVQTPLAQLPEYHRITIFKKMKNSQLNWLHNYKFF